MFVLRFQIWFRYLFIILVVMLGIELSFFMPKSEVYLSLDFARQTKGSIVGVNQSAGEGREYMRALLLDRYRLTETYTLPDLPVIYTANRNLYDQYAYEIDLSASTITLHDVRTSEVGLVCWLGWIGLYLYGVLYGDWLEALWARIWTRRYRTNSK